MISNIRKSVPLVAVLAILLVSLIGWSSRAQTFARVSKARPFEPAEELTYKAEFSRSLLRKLDVATFKFTVIQVPVPAEISTATGSDRPSYILKLIGDAVSQGFFPRLFGISFHQRVESLVEPKSFGVQKTIRLDEQGKRIRASEAIFDYEKSQVTWVERDPGDPSRPPRTVTAVFEGPIQDVLSAIYFLRTRDLEVGKTFDLPLSDSGRVYQVPIDVVEKKRMNTALGRVSVIRVDPQLFKAIGLIDGYGKLSIWLTDDSRRIPVNARLKTEYGTFDITLKKASRQSASQALLSRQ